jgi:hypothetical protein
MLLWVLGSAVLAATCGCSSDSEGDGSGGTAGSTASGGNAGAGTGGSATSGGSGGAATGGVAGTASGGTSGSGGSGGDECNTTAECKQKYGSQATDCANSQSNSSVCMCGSSPCAAGGTGGAAGGGSVQGRIAISADGNFHDRDDIGATPVELAILAQAGLQSKLVHYDHSSHLAQDDADQHGDMIASATGRLTEFGFNSSVVFDDQTQLSAAVANIAKVIDASSAADPLTFVVAGPFEVAWRGIDQADPTKRQYVTLLSHSTWNENHEHVASEHTKDELLADFPTVQYVKISDQNGNAFKSAASSWDWMNAAGPDLTWVRGRMVQAEYAEGDNSDAGMVFYLVTGNQSATMADIKSFFGQ